MSGRVTLGAVLLALALAAPAQANVIVSIEGTDGGDNPTTRSP
jgi:hypothetical protein